MHDALLVRVVQRLARGDEDGGDLGGRQRRAELVGAAPQRREILAVDVLHRQVIGVTVAAEVVDVNDVRMVERGGDLRLVEEHVDEVGLLGEVRQDALDRDALGEPFGAWSAGEKDLGHPADGESLKELVSTYCGRHG